MLEAEIYLLRAQQLQIALLRRWHDPVTRIQLGDVAAFLDQLLRADRYERRGVPHRKFAVRNLTGP